MFASTARFGWLVLLSLAFEVLGITHPVFPAVGQSIKLKRGSQSLRSETQWAQWAKGQRNAVIAKYGLQGHEKRATGENL